MQGDQWAFLKQNTDLYTRLHEYTRWRKIKPHYIRKLQGTVKLMQLQAQFMQAFKDGLAKKFKLKGARPKGKDEKETGLIQAGGNNNDLPSAEK